MNGANISTSTTNCEANWSHSRIKTMQHQIPSINVQNIIKIQHSVKNSQFHRRHVESVQGGFKLLIIKQIILYGWIKAWSEAGDASRVEEICQRDNCCQSHCCMKPDENMARNGDNETIPSSPPLPLSQPPPSNTSAEFLRSFFEKTQQESGQFHVVPVGLILQHTVHHVYKELVDFTEMFATALTHDPVWAWKKWATKNSQLCRLF